MLIELWCYKNQIDSLDISNDSSLIKLWCSENNLKSLITSGAKSLKSINCDKNQLTQFDVSSNIALSSLICSENLLPSLDVSKNINLTSLDCTNNQLTDIDISQSTSLKYFFCNYNRVENLDLSSNRALEVLKCGSNQLTYLDISNNTFLILLEVPEMPNLHKICVWTDPFPPGSVSVYQWNSPNIIFTTDCTGLIYNDLSLNKKIHIYPNPVTDKMFIENIDGEEIVFSIANSTGQIVYYEGCSNKTTHNIDVSDYLDGAYLLSVKTEKLYETVKIIKR